MLDEGQKIYADLGLTSDKQRDLRRFSFMLFSLFVMT